MCTFKFTDVIVHTHPCIDTHIHVGKDDVSVCLSVCLCAYIRTRILVCNRKRRCKTSTTLTGWLRRRRTIAKTVVCVHECARALSFSAHARTHNFSEIGCQAGVVFTAGLERESEDERERNTQRSIEGETESRASGRAGGGSTRTRTHTHTDGGWGGWRGSETEKDRA